MDIFIRFLMDNMVLTVLTGIAVVGIIGLGITLAVLAVRERKRRSAKRDK